MDGVINETESGALLLVSLVSFRQRGME